MIVLFAASAGTTRVLPLCVALSRVLSSSPNATGPSPKVMPSVIAPVLEFLLTVLSVLSDLTGPVKVVVARIFLLEYLNVVPRDVDYTRLHLIYFNLYSVIFIQQFLVESKRACNVDWIFPTM